jgi:hypothetical protein
MRKIQSKFMDSSAVSTELFDVITKFCIVSDLVFVIPLKNNDQYHIEKSFRVLWLCLSLGGAVMAYG